MVDHNFVADNFEKATDQDILAWNEAKLALAKAKARESLLRAKIVKTFFATPKEGTNYHELGAGYKLKLVHKIDRSIDAPLYTNLATQFKDLEIDTDQLAETKLSLKVAFYKKLTEEQRLVVDQCITSKPGSPTLEFVKPKGAE